MSTVTATRVLLAHLFVTGALTGLIWTIQIVHYPLFAKVGRDGFIDYEQSHSFRISTLVGPLMGAELLCALAIAWWPPPGTSKSVAWAALSILAAIHVCTVLFSVRAHNTLGKGFDVRAHRLLVNTNWIRTVGWSVRAFAATYMVSEFITHHAR